MELCLSYGTLLVLLGFLWRFKSDNCVIQNAEVMATIDPQSQKSVLKAVFNTGQTDGWMCKHCIL